MPLLRCLILLGLFLAPGYAVAAGLHRRGEVSAAERWPLGFAWSMAVFGLASWPFLWGQRPFAAFLQVLLPLWAVFGLVGAAAWTLARRRADGGAADHDDEPEPAPAQEDAGSPRAWRWLGLWLLGLLGLAWAWRRWPGGHGGLLAPLCLLGAAGAALGRRLPRRREAPPPPAVAGWWRRVALGLVLGQALCAAVSSRPDWDDCYYLAAVTEFASTPVLNAEEPTHHEGLAAPMQQRLLSWELLSTVLFRASGLDPAVLLRTLWPPLLVLLIYLVYAGLLRELVPRPYVPLGIIGLSALHLLAISSHEALGNFLLPRLWQGKSLLANLFLPLLMLLLLRLRRRPSLALALSLTAAAVGALAVSLSALFLVPALLFGLALALLSPRCRAALGTLLAAAVAAAPVLGAGLWLRGAMSTQRDILQRPVFADSYWQILDNHLRRGGAELWWLASLPLGFVVLRGARARALLLRYGALVALTLLNPLLFPLTARSLTSYGTYFRLLWLLPVNLALAVLLCELWRRWQADHPAEGAWGRRLPALVVLGVLALPGAFVFGPANNYFGPLGRPVLLGNAEKVPPGLLLLLRRLREEPARAGRVLCSEGIASFLVPLDRELRFVQTRASYTPMFLALAGRAREGLERHHLATLLRRPPGTPDDAPPDDGELTALLGEAGKRALFGDALGQRDRNPRALLDRYGVRFAVTGPGDDGTPALARYGFQVLWQDQGFTLWRRDPG